MAGGVTSKNKGNDTPAMRQYRRFKDQHPGCVLFFRMGDFYEMFYDDAELAHRTLGITLTQRTEGVPMAGVPYHSVEGYLRRMIQAGHRVAVCDQVEDASQAKGVVKRDVTRVVTPGTLTDEGLLDESTPAPLAAVSFPEDGVAALAWAELSTGAFWVMAVPAGAARDELARIGPAELLYCETADSVTPARVSALVEGRGEVPPLTPRPAWSFRLGEAAALLKKQYRVAELTGFGFADDDPALGAAGAVLHYLLETQRPGNDGGDTAATLSHLRPPRRFHREAHLIIDQTSLASLEVERTLRGNGTAGSLVGVLGGNGRACATAMGKRKLRDWLCFPLADRDAILERQRVVAALVEDTRFADELAESLDGVQDVPRLCARLSVGRASPRDLVALGRSTGAVQRIAASLDGNPTVRPYHQRVAAVHDVLLPLSQRILDACRDDPPAHLREGGLFIGGHDVKLDEQRRLMADSDTWLAQYQGQLTQETGIASLKVGYNKVFGYYIEVTAANKTKADEFMQTDAGRPWTRKQTLKNAERYITPELKEYEGNVLSAKDRAVAREQELFAGLCGDCEKQLDALHAFSEAVAELDVLLCFARRAVKHNYCRPELTDEPVLRIEAGRHPVLDELIDDQFVPNDVALRVSGGQWPVTDEVTKQTQPSSTGDQTPPVGYSLQLITGPNMAGKSTYIRQAALIALLAHTGSFVPATSATVGMCDRIFTRVGAHDELHAGRSTFMVEMTETANICHHATSRSLVILDEIGRGTSTLDGLALAWAITEHLAHVGCRALFATHYHELTALAERFENVGNLNVTAREWNDQIVFLHRVEPGATDRSYGIAVAKLAGLPRPVVDRANALLRDLAVSHGTPPAQAKSAGQATASPSPPLTPQMSLFTEYLNHPAIDALRDLDLDQMSPLDAFDALRKLRDRVDDGEA